MVKILTLLLSLMLAAGPFGSFTAQTPETKTDGAAQQAALETAEENHAQNNHHKQPGSDIRTGKSHSALNERNPLPSARVEWHMNDSNTTGQHPNALKENGSEEIN